MLLEYRTIIDNVILPLLIRGEDKKTAREYGAQFFPRFGLSGYEKKYPGELSGGMRQRAALLRTCLSTVTAANAGGIAANSKTKERYHNIHTLPCNSVILLDEPFSALDAITRRKMQAWYAGIAEQMNVSTLFITHDVEEALTLSDTVYIINGRPAKITHVIDVNPPRPRDSDFTVSLEFARLKKQILEAIGQ
jgi:ABC-type nitrate/sulfonate/bicarbonate transport system ATPase subunit